MKFKEYKFAFPKQIRFVKLAFVTLKWKRKLLFTHILLDIVINYKKQNSVSSQEYYIYI